MTAAGGYWTVAWCTRCNEKRCNMSTSGIQSQRANVRRLSVSEYLHAAIARRIHPHIKVLHLLVLALIEAGHGLHSSGRLSLWIERKRQWCWAHVYHGSWHYSGHFQLSTWSIGLLEHRNVWQSRQLWALGSSDCAPMGSKSYTSFRWRSEVGHIVRSQCGRNECDASYGFAHVKRYIKKLNWLLIGHSGENVSFCRTISSGDRHERLWSRPIWRPIQSDRHGRASSETFQLLHRFHDRDCGLFTQGMTDVNASAARLRIFNISQYFPEGGCNRIGCKFSAITGIR